jgi:hypothetical protein
MRVLLDRRVGVWILSYTSDQYDFYVLFVYGMSMFGKEQPQSGISSRTMQNGIHSLLRAAPCVEQTSLGIETW